MKEVLLYLDSVSHMLVIGDIYKSNFSFINQLVQSVISLHVLIEAPVHNIYIHPQSQTQLKGSEP